MFHIVPIDSGEHLLRRRTSIHIKVRLSADVTAVGRPSTSRMRMISTGTGETFLVLVRIVGGMKDSHR